ncbi:MAG: endonuclease/exonuclease/phosphatase family protein [Deltaproteobacteria bacterium]|nr:endonuclease/exonuclease/phosphatase family protein [Deltaproteobacteria bacterium]
MRRLRLMTWNVHSARGLDRRVDLARIAAVIEPWDADVIALQEIDARSRRSKGVDQLQALGERLGRRALFCATMPRAGGLYGHGLLCRWPVRDSWSRPLPVAPGSEPRAWLRTRLEATGASSVDVLSTHLSLGPSDRARQAAMLAKEVVQTTVRPDRALVLVGDLNSRPGSASYQLLASVLRDACREASERVSPTWPSPAPFVRIDHVLVAGPVRARAAMVVRTAETRVASDHLPVVVDLELDVETVAAA